MVSTCFYFQVHQPHRLRNYQVFEIGNNHNYFDESKNEQVIRKVIQKCYLPANNLILDLINKHDGHFKVSYSITGTILEQFEKYAPEVIDSFKVLSKTGCVDFLDETYYHSLAFLYSKEEFKKQILLHNKKMQQLFNVSPKIFRNTELIYNNDLAKFISSLGYKGIIAEGAKHILEWRSPNYVYKPKDTDMKLLLKNYQLSDDIAFRFGEASWKEYPLNAPKFAQWVNSINGDGYIVNLFMDYETFGEHQWKDKGIFEFLKSLPNYILANPDNNFITPTEALKIPAVGELDFPYPVSWADIERDVSAWIGNEMQKDALQKLYSLESQIMSSNNYELIKDWRALQTSDHFYYMCTKWFADGDVHKYFNPFDSPYDAFINFMNVLNDIKIRTKEVKESKMASKLLDNVPDQNAFWVCDGKILKNLYDLAKAFKEMSDDTYGYHANLQKNDFACWVGDIIKDKKLVNDILRSRSRQQAAKAVEKRIKELA